MRRERRVKVENQMTTVTIRAVATPAEVFDVAFAIGPVPGVVAVTAATAADLAAAPRRRAVTLLSAAPAVWLLVCSALATRPSAAGLRCKAGPCRAAIPVEDAGAIAATGVAIGVLALVALGCALAGTRRAAAIALALQAVAVTVAAAALA